MNEKVKVCMVKGDKNVPGEGIKKPGQEFEIEKSEYEWYQKNYPGRMKLIDKPKSYKEGKP